MKKIYLLFSILTLALASPAFCQTWLRIVPAEDAATTVQLPAGATIRWCDAATAKTCSPVETFAAATTIAAYCPGVPACAAADSTDGLHGVLKDLEILELAGIAQNVVVKGSPITIPAQPLPSYAPISFTPGIAYTFYLTNVATSGSSSPLQALLQIVDGKNVVTSTCAYKTTEVVAATASTPAGQRAVITCVPVPVK